MDCLLFLKIRSHFGSSNFGSSHFGSSHFGSSITFGLTFFQSLQWLELVQGCSLVRAQTRAPSRTGGFYWCCGPPPRLGAGALRAAAFWRLPALSPTRWVTIQWELSRQGRTESVAYQGHVQDSGRKNVYCDARGGCRNAVQMRSVRAMFRKQTGIWEITPP